MNGFRQRLTSAIEASPIYRSNITKLAADAGLGQKTIYNMLNDPKMDCSEKGPGIFAMQRVATLLETSLDHLTSASPLIASPRQASALSDHIAEGLKAQTFESINTINADYLLRLYAKSGARIEAFEGTLTKADQYERQRSKDAVPTVKSVGKTSLSAITMGTSDASILQAALDHTEPELQQELAADYFDATERGSLVTVQSLDVQMPNRPVRVRMDFIRLLFLLADKDENETLVNYSILIT